MATALSVKERAEKTVSELEGFHKLLAAFTSQWRGLDAFIAEIDKSLALKQEELQAKERAFEEQNLLASQALDRREAAILVREQTSISKVQQLRDAAIAKYGNSENLATEKKDDMEEDAQRDDGDGDVAMTDKEACNGDAAMTESKENPVADVGVAKETPAPQPQVRVRPQIVSLCESMDGEGLRKYIVDHRREIDSLRNEVTVALHSAIDPTRLVLKALEGYDDLELDSNHAKEMGLSTNRRACILLLECLGEVLADPVLPGEQQAVVPPTIKEAAKEVAKLWRSKGDAPLSSADHGSENSLDAQAFLQLLVTFGLTSEFEEDELLKLAYAVCRRRQTPALCQALGLRHKMPEFVETLNRDGKQIEALAFAHYFGLMDKVQPASMLKAYLKEVRKVGQDIPRHGANFKHEFLMKELSAVKAVLRVIEEYDLADQYPTDGLQRRLAQLEKVKADRRKPLFLGKGPTHSKKPRLGGGGQVGAGLPHPVSVNRGQYGGPNAVSFAMSNQAAYDGHSQAAFGSAYGTDTRSPASISNSYMYSSEAVSGAVYPTAPPAYPGAPGGYSGYPYAPGVVPQQPSYQPSYVG